MVDFGQDILEYVLEHGPIALFFMLMLDSAMILPFVPGELMLVVAVQQFATSRATLVFIILVATLGTTAGSLLLYGIARGGGRVFIEKHPRLFLMSPETRDKLERTFQRPLGQSLVLFLRLFPFTRILVSLPAGLAKMPWIRFTILTFIGNLIFNSGVMYLTYEARQPNSQVAAYLGLARDRYIDPLWLLVLANW
ncbi:MAG TPA: DedA family protein, partial [Candidatus Thermoplasmatota archaeon]|nr:DedA family protein [Candidatus Thermoplasmatota archaeon]